MAAVPVEQANSCPSTPLSEARSLSPPVQPCSDVCGQTAHPSVARQRWHGVNLGGWLLLEPGPAKALFSRHLEGSVEATCEWDLMKILERKGGVDFAREEMKQHRETYICRSDFEQIRNCGLNAVRLPFGYWTVLGPGHGEPYIGPSLEYIDKAILWAAEYGLQVVLDLHGAPGGESGGAPCGRQQEPHDAWQWEDWRTDESLHALELIAARYCKCPNVTGIEVCNEPSRTIPTSALCRFYAQAVATIRQAGMHEDNVSVILPVFQRPKATFAKAWHALIRQRCEFQSGIYDNVAFDFHYYHCFGSHYDGYTLAQQLRKVERNAEELRHLPAVVGEWSLAVGCAASQGRLTGEELRALFGQLQLQAYENASHGWFFWNWKDGNGVEWCWQDSYKEGVFSSRLGEPSVMNCLRETWGRSRLLPEWDCRSEDPLEEWLDPSPPERDISVGDTVSLRSYNNRHIVVSSCGESVTCSSKRCNEALFTICGHNIEDGTPIVDGSTVRLRTPTGAFLFVDKDRGQVFARHMDDENEDFATVFITHVKGMHGAPRQILQHRGTVYFQSLATLTMVHLDDGLKALWDHCGDWQRFVVDKRSTQFQGEGAVSSEEAKHSLCSRSPSPASRASSTCSTTTADWSPEKVSHSKRRVEVPTFVEVQKRQRSQSLALCCSHHGEEASSACLELARERGARSRSRSRSRSTSSTECPGSASEVST